MSRSRTFVPIETSPDLISFFVDDAGVREPLLEQRDARLEMGLLVLRRVVLGVLGDVAELARDADALRDLAARSLERYSISSLSFSKPSGVRMTSFKTALLDCPDKTAGG